MNLKKTVFIIPNKGIESTVIAEILQQQPGANIMISNQSRFKEATWQNVEGEIRFNVNKFREQHCEYEVEDTLGTLPCVGTLKEALAANGANIKSAANVIGINLGGPELYHGDHIVSTPEVSALEKIAKELDIDLTFDQVLIAAYARGGVAEVAKIGRALEMRQDETINKIVDIMYKDDPNNFPGVKTNPREITQAKERIDNALSEKCHQKENVYIVNMEQKNHTDAAIMKELLQADTLIVTNESGTCSIYASKETTYDLLKELYPSVYFDAHGSYVANRSDVPKIVDYINEFEGMQQGDTIEEPDIDDQDLDFDPIE